MVFEAGSSSERHQDGAAQPRPATSSHREVLDEVAGTLFAVLGTLRPHLHPSSGAVTLGSDSRAFGARLARAIRPMTASAREVRGIFAGSGPLLPSQDRQKRLPSIA